jgi:hypothetical protein
MKEIILFIHFAVNFYYENHKNRLRAFEKPVNQLVISKLEDLK